MATLLKVWNNLADIKSAGGVALGLGTQGPAPVDIGGLSRRKEVIRLDAGRPRFHTDAGFGEEAARDAMMGV
jgi:hypothetical protein